MELSFTVIPRCFMVLLCSLSFMDAHSEKVKDCTIFAENLPNQIFRASRIFTHSEMSVFYKGKLSALDLLPSDQRQEIEEYMETENHVYRQLNRYLRSGRTPPDRKLNARLRRIEKAFDRLEQSLPEDLALFRGMSFDHLGRYPKRGEVISDEGIVSMSLDPKIASTFGLVEYALMEVKKHSALVVNVQNPQKTQSKVRGLYVRHEADDDASSELEVIVRPGSHFQVLDFRDIEVKNPIEPGSKVKRRIVLVQPCESAAACGDFSLSLVRKSYSDLMNQLEKTLITP